MKILTVKEAVAMVQQGKTLEGVVLEESTARQVNVRDALVLARGGMVIPEENIYYLDDEIAYDEDIDELETTSGIVNLSWEEKASRAQALNANQSAVMVMEQQPSTSIKPKKSRQRKP